MKAYALSLVALALCACSGRDSKPADSTLASDLALASQMQAAQPQFQDTAASQPTTAVTNPRSTSRIQNPPRTRTVPRATTTAPQAAARAEIASGAGFALASQQRICTSSNRPGDRFVATVTSPVVGTNGAVVPAGSSMVLEVASVSSETGAMTLTVHSVEFNGMSYPVSGEVVSHSELERTKIVTDPNADKKKVIGGAIAGAILGRVIGKSTKGTVIGAATGAATGAVVAKAGEKFEACLPVGGAVRVSLNQPLIL